MAIELHHADLAACESVIERGLQSFVELGLALGRINDAELYRDTHRTFATYCRGRWGISRDTAYNYIKAAKAVLTIVNNAPELVPPPKESVARELTRTDDPVATWRKAVESAPGGKVTASHVRSVVESMRKPEAEPEEDTDDQFASEERDENDVEEPGKQSPPVDSSISAEGEPASERRPVTVTPPPEEEEPEPSAQLQAVADAWNEMDGDEQNEFLSAVGAVRFSTLEALAEQRMRDTSYSVRRNSMATGSVGARMVNAVLDGGDWALARLGLTWSSTEEEAKRAYRQASLVAHPDRGGSNEEFTAIGRANEIVMRWLQGRAA